MQDDSSPAGSQEPPGDAVHTLGDVMKHDFVIQHVFDYLVEDGLQECRRVCRHWYEASKKYPLKLFPMVASISYGCRLLEEEKDIDFKRDLDFHGDHGWHTMDSHLSQIFSFAPHLKHLDLSLSANQATMAQWDAFFSTLETLESLTMEFVCDLDQPWFDLQSVGRLTKLTSLSLLCRAENIVNEKPIAELRRLKKLEIDFRHLRVGEQMALSSLSGLVSLAFFDPGRKLRDEDRLPLLKTALPWASTIKELEWPPLLMLPHASDMPSLNEIGAFSRLENLDWVFNEQLTVKWFSGIDTPSFANLSSLDRLKSFSFTRKAYYYQQTDTIDMSGLQSLTSFSFVDGPASFDGLNLLTDLKAFEFSTFNTNLVGVSRVMECLMELVSLEELELFLPHTALPRGIISVLQNLRSVTLHLAALEPNIFDELVSLTGLTNLRMMTQDSSLLVALSRLKLCHKLVHLALRLERFSEKRDDELEMLRSPQPCFSSLRYLTIYGVIMTQQDTNDIKKCIPDLRRLSIE